MFYLKGNKLYTLVSIFSSIMRNIKFEVNITEEKWDLEIKYGDMVETWYRDISSKGKSAETFEFVYNENIEFLQKNNK